MNFISSSNAFIGFDDNFPLTQKKNNKNYKRNRLENK